MNDKNQFLEVIQSNIDNYGYHVTIVNNAIEPRYAYTIGLTKLFGFELIFAGGIYYMKDELFVIFEIIVSELKKGQYIENQKVVAGTLGIFSLSKVEPSWSKSMMLGAFDYYKNNHIKSFQIMPDLNHYTLDIPDMTKQFNASLEPVWQWLVHEWNYPVPKDSTTTTNLDALFGKSITEVMRWEENEWEMFAGAGPDVQEEDMRVVSLGTLLGIDKSLHPVIELEVGKGLWRSSINAEWNQWG